jgi:hypothetical protein
MLEKAGLALDHQEIGSAPQGKLCQVREGIKGDSMVQYETNSIDLLAFVLEHTASSMVRNGTLEIPPGNVVSGEDLQAILKEITEGLRTEGAIIPVAYFVARKEKSSSE